ncbi:VTT domain-containing protein [Frigidibacter sp. MR17.14]|uniref:YqaA family protein n=1 Tax=Frigidibacter sp. MR17.14 TaxID=3126509 RepID=UPI003012F1D0
MIRRLYDWTMRLAGTRHANTALAGVAFAESSFFPLPPDLLLIPMVIARRDRAFVIAAISTVASVLGGLFGYLIGWGLMDAIGRPVLEFYGKGGDFDSLAAQFNALGFWAVLIAGVTPFPYKVITIFSGATGLNIVLFVLVSILARALRFFVVAALLWKWGPPMRDFIERRLGLVFTVFCLLLVAGVAAVRLL